MPAPNRLGYRDRPAGREAHEQAFLLGLGMDRAVDVNSAASRQRTRPSPATRIRPISGSAIVTGRR